MYQFTENPDALARAESVYINILNQRRDDIVANFRLGALYRKLSRFDESREYLRTARDGLLGSQDPEINTSHFIYDHVRREIGLTEWRIAEDQTRPVEVRRDSLVVALRSAHDVIHKPAVSDRYSRLSAINDFLYYYKFEASRVPGVRESFAVPPAEVDAYVDELYRYYRGLDPAKLSYNWVDTLLRCYPDDKEKALELIDQLEILLERLVTDRKPRLLDNVPARGTHRWFGTLASELDPDERDSLIFAQETKEKWTRK
jgi:tetratricopeptide (TPR) repeat protein